MCGCLCFGWYGTTAFAQIPLFTIFMKMVVLFANKKALDLYRLDVKYCFAKYKIRIGQLIDAPDLKTIG